MMEPALQLALHGTAYRTGAVTSARRVLMSYELGGCAGDWQGPLCPQKGAKPGLLRPIGQLWDSIDLFRCRRVRMNANFLREPSRCADLGRRLARGSFR